jgi:hypothetical protein
MVDISKLKMHKWYKVVTQSNTALYGRLLAVNEIYLVFNEKFKNDFVKVIRKDEIISIEEWSV